MAGSQYRNRNDPCPMCSSTYGLRVDDPERCGVCITGLSLDGRPIEPTRDATGRMVCPMCDSMCAKCDLEPHPDWPGAWTHRRTR